MRMIASFLTAAVAIVPVTDAVVRVAPTALANDNGTPAGTLVRDTLVLQLVVGPAA